MRNLPTDRLWVEEGEPQRGIIAEVAPVAHVGRTYSFAVPQAMSPHLAIGQRVQVPMRRGGRLAVGFVVGLSEGPWDSSLRPVDSLVDSEAFLTPELIELGRQISEHYCCRLGLVLKAMTPEAVRQERGLKNIRYVRLLHPPTEALELPAAKTAKRRALIAALGAAPGPLRLDALLRQCNATTAVVQALVREGIVEIEIRKEMAPDESAETTVVEPGFELTEEQCQALAAVRSRIDQGRFCVSLLFGVSGSGKTEIYIRAMQAVIRTGKQAMLLVPEIMLTTQLVVRLASRLPSVAVAHSGLSDAQRSILWRQVAAGEKQVVIGTRSAVFSPCPRLGLICVDEEQEGGYKNQQAPRFHVRDVAIMRGKQLGIPVVLGSATPSVEVWHHGGHHPDYSLLRLQHRVKELPMPKVYVVDMRDEHLESKGNVVFSRLMLRLLTETLDRKEQAMLLVNRRGFAHRVFCPACSTRLCCPHCSVGLVVHEPQGESICHYCRTRMPTPTHCPGVNCGHELRRVGTGTQRVEELLKVFFPQTRLMRVDSDTMRHRRDYQSAVDRFAARDIDILLGTQMIAKGLDFPAVSFVGIVDADATGMSADFRAHERLFQLVTQTAGRAGRADAGGRVVVQTMSPDMPALGFALRHDYEGFAAAELLMRQGCGLPPFRRLVRFVLSHGREDTVRGEAESLTGRIRDAIAALRVSADTLGPNLCVIPRLRGLYRMDALLRTDTAATMRRILHHLEQARALRAKSAKLMIDVDPVALT